MKKLTPQRVNTRTQWNKFYTESGFDYFEKDQGDKPWQILQFIEDNDTILDVGAGYGKIPFLMKWVRPNIEVSVMDFSDTAVDSLKKFKDIFAEVFRADVMKMNRHDNAYDVAVCCEVLEHLTDPKGAVKEMARVARRKIIVTTPFRERTHDPSHLWELDLGDVYDWLEPYGTVTLKVINGGSNILGIVCLK